VLQLNSTVEIKTVLSIKEFDPKMFIFMATQLGIVKRVSLELFANVRKTGIAAINLSDEDQLIGAHLCEEKDEAVLATKKGLSIKFKIKEVRPTGRQSQGVKGIKLGKGDIVLGAVLVSTTLKKENFYLLTVTKNGFAKRTHIDGYRSQSRSGKGVTNIKLSSKIGEVQGLALVKNNDGVMGITQKGILIRINIKDVRVSGRATQGVKIINLDKGDNLSTIARIIPEEE